MYQINDMVMHPGAGVCRITDIRREKFSPAAQGEYYILTPVYENTTATIFVLVDSPKIRLRKILSREEIYTMIRAVPQQETLLPEEEKLRQETMTRLLKEGSHSELIRMIWELHEKKNARESAGKHLGSTEERALHEAERLIHQEFAYALELKPEEIAPFIMGELQIPEQPAGKR